MRGGECLRERVDVYGTGLDGEQIPWCPLYPNRPYRNRVEGLVTRDKKQIVDEYRFCIATENYAGRRMWIGEKMFDAFFAGTVPVYLGEESIADWVPQDSFVDMRRFKTDAGLLEYLRDCKEAEWKTMRDAGQAFLASDKMRSFTDESFAERMVHILKVILGNS